MDDIETYFYDKEEELGRRRIQRELIEESDNVVEFEPYVLGYIYETYGEAALFKAYTYYLENGYELIDKEARPIEG